MIELLTGEQKTFDFEVYFHEVFAAKGGFDVAIGNPPYISHDRITKTEKKYLKKHYTAFEPFADLYCYFLEAALNIQNQTGLMCFITSNSYLRAGYGQPLRKQISQSNRIIQLINIEDFQVFDSAIVNSAVLLSQNQKSAQKRPDARVVNKPFTGNMPFLTFVAKHSFLYPHSELSEHPWLLLPPKQLQIKQKIEGVGRTLEQLNTKIRLGIATGANHAFVIDESQREVFAKKNPKNLEIIKPILRGRDISRYSYQLPGLFILLTRNGIDVRAEYPDIYNYLDSFGEAFKTRGAQGQHWTNLRACSFFDDFKKEKIVWIELTDNGRFALCQDEVYLLNSAYFLLPPEQFDSHFLLGILNSNVIQFYLHLTADTSGMGTARWINRHVKNFSIPTVDRESQEPIASLVKQIVKAKQASHELDTIDQETQVEQLIYELYDLDLSEINLIERSI